MSAFEYVLLAMGGNALLLGALAYLCKSIVAQYLAKDLEAFKTSLVQTSTNAAEQLKHQLNLAAHIHNTRFSRLHERQAHVLEDIYARILRFEDAAGALTMVTDEVPQELREATLSRAVKAGRDLQQYIRENLIYLPTSTSDNLREMLDRIFRLLGDCSFNLIGEESEKVGWPNPFPEAKEAWSRVSTFLAQESPAVRQSLEMEFRRLLGTELE